MMSSVVESRNANSNLQMANGRLLDLGNLRLAICILQFAIVLPAVAQESASLTALEESALRDAADSVADCVVQIRTIGGLDALEGALSADGPTTGLIISMDGYIVSSAFNFLQQPASIIVTFASG
jgi:serine protease Do